MKNNKGFTLVELLAVIVILAVILVIAVPKILDTINKSKISSMESSAKMVASAVETAYQTSLATGSTMPENCMGLGNLDTNEYESCTYTLVDGKATVTLTGKTGGKFDGLTASGTKTSASLVTGPTLPEAKANFDAYDWSEIKTLVHAVTTEDLTFEELASTYNLAVGQEKSIDLGSLGEHTVRIANMSNGEANTCGTAGFSESACGFVVEFKDIITTHNMNPSGTYTGSNTNYTGQTFEYGWNIGGWEDSSMRTYVNTDIYNAIVAKTGDIIADTTVVSGHGNGTSDSTNFTTTDKIYLLSTHEVWSNNTNYDTAYANTRQLDYYKNNNVTTSSNSGAIKYNGTSAGWWWLRGAISDITVCFFYVYSSGGWGGNGASYAGGVSPAFRIT